MCPMADPKSESEAIAVCPLVDPKSVSEATPVCPRADPNSDMDSQEGESNSSRNGVEAATLCHMQSYDTPSQKVRV